MQIRSSMGTAVTICSELHTIAPKGCHFILNCVWLSIEVRQGFLWVRLLPTVSQVTTVSDGSEWHSYHNVLLQLRQRVWKSVVQSIKSIFILALNKHLVTSVPTFVSPEHGLKVWPGITQ